MKIGIAVLLTILPEVAAPTPAAIAMAYANRANANQQIVMDHVHKAK
jgi:hypothetical protein